MIDAQLPLGFAGTRVQWLNDGRKGFLFPFDGLTPLRGEWDEYFLLRVLLNRRETKMSPQMYR